MKSIFARVLVLCVGALAATQNAAGTPTAATEADAARVAVEASAARVAPQASAARVAPEASAARVAVEASAARAPAARTPVEASAARVAVAATATAALNGAASLSLKEDLLLRSADDQELSVRQSDPLNFDSSFWIWTADAAGSVDVPAESRSFRKTWVPPEGKVPQSAEIIMTTDNAYTLYVNGDFIGNGTNWSVAGRYCVKLKPCLNVFAVQAVNYDIGVNNPAGVLAAIQVTYLDGSTSLLKTDGSWRANTYTPGMESMRFDDSAWPTATVEASYTSSLWGAIRTPGIDALSFAASTWIWTNELNGGNAPVGSRVFRRTVEVPTGLFTRASATIIITVDNAYTLYVNGVQVGTGNDFTVAQRYTVNNIAGPKVVFAVLATNTATVPNPAGILAAIELSWPEESKCCQTSQFIDSDTSWKFNTQQPAGWNQPDFDDSNWPNAVGEGSNGVPPWGTIAVPA